MRRPSALSPDTGWCHPSTTFGLTSTPILHSSGIRLTTSAPIRSGSSVSGENVEKGQ